MLGEVGSVVSLYKKRLRQASAAQFDPAQFKKELAEEIGDLLWYIANLASRERLSLAKIANQNLIKARSLFDKGKITHFDKNFPLDERFPRRFSVRFTERRLRRRTLVKISVSRVSYFALHKMFYLIEYHSVKERGERFTGAYMVRQKEGPYCVDLALANISRQFPHIRIRRLAGVLTIETIGKGEYFDLLTPLQKRTSDIEIDPIVARVVAKFGAYSDAQLKTYVYLTKPMKRILREELRYRRNMLNAPINFDGVYAHKGK